MRRALLSVLFVTGCSADPIVGRWAGGREPVVFHDDGRAELPVNGVEASCADDAAVIAACAKTQRWERRGDRYRLTLAAISRPRDVLDHPQPGPCKCGHEHVEVEVHGDDLTIVGSDERLRRIR